jgi:hypothetical protein
MEGQRDKERWPNRRDRKMKRKRDRHSVTQELKDMEIEGEKYRHSNTKRQKDRLKVNCRDRVVE